CRSSRLCVGETGMSQFLRLLHETDKAAALAEVSQRQRSGEDEARAFEVQPDAFDAVPGNPFAYWVSEAVLSVFGRLPSTSEVATVVSGTGTLDDFRFLRCWWEVQEFETRFPFAKGGTYSPLYYDQHLSVSWKNDGAEMKAWIVFRYGGGHWARNIRSTEY